jgi:hypothetical protein
LVADFALFEDGFAMRRIGGIGAGRPNEGCAKHTSFNQYCHSLLLNPFKGHLLQKGGACLKQKSRLNSISFYAEKSAVSGDGIFDYEAKRVTVW